MDGIILEQSEFLLLLDAVNANELIAIDSAKVLPRDREEHRRLGLEGIEKLKDRGWLTLQDGVYMLNPDLVIMVGTVAHPTLALVVIRDIPAGRQEFLYYRSEQAIVEFTLPAEGQYRLATLPNIEMTVARIQFLLAEDAPERDPAHSFTIDQDAFFAVREQMLAGDRATAEAILTSHDVAAATRRTLLDAMSEPLLSGTVAILRCEEDVVVDARNLAVLIGPQVAWAFQQTEAGVPQMRAETIDEASLSSILLDLLASLVEASAAI